MTRDECNRFRAILEARELELSRHLRNREGLVVMAVPDGLDEACHAVNRELAIRNLDHMSGLLKDVEAALRRIEDGICGICLHCEGDIGRKRLEAVLWLHCVSGVRRLRIAPAQRHLTKRPKASMGS